MEATEVTEYQSTRVPPITRVLLEDPDLSTLRTLSNNLSTRGTYVILQPIDDLQDDHEERPRPPDLGKVAHGLRQKRRSESRPERLVHKCRRPEVARVLGHDARCDRDSAEAKVGPPPPRGRPEGERRDVDAEERRADACNACAYMLLTLAPLSRSRSLARKFTPAPDCRLGCLSWCLPQSEANIPTIPKALPRLAGLQHTRTCRRRGGGVK
jgi:hypothetical protein